MSNPNFKNKVMGIDGDWLELAGREAERTYHLAAGPYIIKEPQYLLRRDSGTHRIVDATGRCHIVDVHGKVAPISFMVSDTATCYFIA